MAATPEVDSVWIGFMDIVPVIGTVKEAVELVVALYEGNDRVIREKAKAVENFVKQSLKKPVKKSVPGKPAAAADTSDFSGLRNVREVRREKIIEYMGKGSKRRTKPAPARQEQRKTSVNIEAIKEEILRKIHIIDQNFNQELQIELTQSRRGEHVFNNDILKFHSSVLAAFVKTHNIHNLHKYKTNQEKIDKLGKHTLPQNTENDIQKMVVYFGADEHYVNANAVMYGVYKRHLLDALLVVLNHINPGKETLEETDRVNHIINNMNNLEIYVDELAKVKWIDNKQDKQDQVEAVRAKVVTMFNTGHLIGWCNSVLKEVAPCFGNSQ